MRAGLESGQQWHRCPISTSSARTAATRSVPTSPSVRTAATGCASARRRSSATARSPSRARPARRASPPHRGCRASAPGEIPGIRGELTARPYATITLVVLSLFGYLVLFPVALGRHRRHAADQRPVVAGGDVALPVREHLVRAGRGHRHRGLRLAAGAPPRAARGRSSSSCCAGWAASRWPWRSIRRRWPSAATARRSACCARGPSRTSWRAAAARSTTATCSGTAVFAAVLLLMPLAVLEASAIAGFAGGAAGLLVGLVLARARIA